MSSCQEEVSQFEPKPAFNQAAGMGLRGHVSELLETEFLEGPGNPVQPNQAAEKNRQKSKEDQYRFNEAGALLERKVFVGAILVMREFRGYDEYGRQSGAKSVEKDGKSLGEWSFVYGENGKIREKQFFNDEGYLTKREKFEYDETGRETAMYLSMYTRA
ncbi:MAG TPA: hypothetical protein ENJ82_14015, partial [Bacteroidetes bacterium]|nr:hypothetical protein [Bacteroidota bacterium]